MGFCCRGLGWGGWSGWGGLGLLGPTLIGLVLLVGVVAVLGLGAIWVVRRSGQAQGAMDAPRKRGGPLDIARQRLAAGELTMEEFEEIRDRLRR